MPDIDAIDGDGPLIDVVEAGHEVGKRGLAGTGGPDERDRRPTRDDGVDTGEHRAGLLVSERHLAEAHLAWPGS